MAIVRVLIIGLAIAAALWLGVHLLAERPAPPMLLEQGCREFFTVRPIPMDCGWLQLPRDHLRADSPRDIKLPWVRFRARQPNGRAVLVPGGGGPGSSVGFGWVDNPTQLLVSLESVLAAGYDVVMVEERGVGWAEPDASCIEYLPIVRAAWRGELNLSGELTRGIEATAQCQQRLGRQGHLPQHFSVAQSARDMVSAMVALAYPQWAVVATSHASVIALAVANLEPAGLAALVLDSPVSLVDERPISLESMHAQIRAVLAACQRDPACAQRFPALDQQLQRAITQLREAPLTVPLDDWSASATQRATISARIDDLRLQQILFASSYWVEDIGAMPLMLEQVRNGSTELLSEAAATLFEMEVDSDFSDGLANTVHCSFYLPRQQNWLRSNPGSTANWGQASQTLWQGLIDSCARWSSEISNLSDTELLDTQLPTLVLAGGLDPATLATDSAQLAASLAAGQFWLDPGGSHALAYYSDCARQHIVRFLEHQQLADCQADSRIEWLLN